MAPADHQQSESLDWAFMTRQFIDEYVPEREENLIG